MGYAAAAAVTATNMAGPPLTSVLVSACTQMAPIVSSILFVAPLPTIQKIAADKNVGDLPLLPYSSMVANAFLWVMYGALKSELKVIVPNTFGFFMGMYYTWQFCRFCPKNSYNLPGTIVQHKIFTSSIIFSAILIVGVLKRQHSSNIIGKLGVTVCIILFASPLAALKTVMKKKSAKSIPLPFTLACLINCFLWSVAGLFEMKDFYIYFPNLLGFASAAVQLFLLILYREKKDLLPF